MPSFYINYLIGTTTLLGSSNFSLLQMRKMRHREISSWLRSHTYLVAEPASDQVKSCCSLAKSCLTLLLHGLQAASLSTISHSLLKLITTWSRLWQNMLHWRMEWQTTSIFLPWEPHKQVNRVHCEHMLHAVNILVHTSSCTNEKNFSR